MKITEAKKKNSTNKTEKKNPIA